MFPIFLFLFCCANAFTEHEVLVKIAEAIGDSGVFTNCKQPDINCGNTKCHGDACGQYNDSFYVVTSNGAITSLFVPFQFYEIFFQFSKSFQ